VGGGGGGGGGEKYAPLATLCVSFHTTFKLFTSFHNLLWKFDVKSQLSHSDVCSNLICVTFLYMQLTNRNLRKNKVNASFYVCCLLSLQSLLKQYVITEELSDVPAVFMCSYTLKI